MYFNQCANAFFREKFLMINEYAFLDPKHAVLTIKKLSFASL